MEKSGTIEKLVGKNGLRVDDDERSCFALSAFLESLKIKITTVPNGAEAPDVLKKGSSFDIILLDIMMDGYEMLQVLKANSGLRAIPVIAVTARAMKADREKCIEAGAWDYMPKPIDLKTLKEKLLQWLDDPVVPKAGGSQQAGLAANASDKG